MISFFDPHDRSTLVRTDLLRYKISLCCSDVGLVKIDIAETSLIPQGKLENPKTLSGGEKSFSTIALLLTLWDSVNCPIRCLDEFDVFMDDVNRRVALKMMVCVPIL